MAFQGFDQSEQGNHSPPLVLLQLVQTVRIEGLGPDPPQKPDAVDSPDLLY